MPRRPTSIIVSPGTASAGIVVNHDSPPIVVNETTETDDNLVVVNPYGPRGPQGEDGEPGEDGATGPQGPQGNPGGTDIAAISYVHTQGTPADVWIIPHGLSFRPHFQVFDSAGEEAHGGVVHSSGLTTITFTPASFSGVAYGS